MFPESDTPSEEYTGMPQKLPGTCHFPEGLVAALSEGRHGAPGPEAAGPCARTCGKALVVDAVLCSPDSPSEDEGLNPPDSESAASTQPSLSVLVKNGLEESHTVQGPPECSAPVPNWKQL